MQNHFMAIVAVGAGVLATALAFAYISAATSEPEQERKVSVLFVANDVPANHVLDPETDLRVEQVGVISTPGLARAAVKSDELDALRGRRINGPLPAGVPLMYSHLATVQDIELSFGTRAMTISVGTAGGLGGILIPGDHVDIIVSHKARAANETAVGPDVDFSDPQASLGAIFANVTAQSTNPGRWDAQEVLSNIRVIAVGDQLRMSRQQLAYGPQSRQGGAKRTVTIEVTPEQAIQLIKATSGGANPITLLLRPADLVVTEPSGGSLIEEEGP